MIPEGKEWKTKRTDKGNCNFKRYANVYVSFLFSTNLENNSIKQNTYNIFSSLYYIEMIYLQIIVQRK